MPDITAIRFSGYGGPEVLVRQRVPAPQRDAGEVLVDVHAVSINPIDWKVRAGMLSKAFPSAFPMTTGRDGAGIIRAAEDATSVGRRVCFLAPRGVGTWAEQIALPAALAVPIPDTLSFTEAAALPLAGISAWAALVTAARIGPGIKVLIHAAAGGVGGFAVQIARDRGAAVAATCSHSNIGYVRALGAETVIAYDRETFEERLSGLDIVLDTMGGDVHRRSYAVLRKGGMLACLSAAPFEDRGADYGVTVKMAKVAPDPAVLAELVALAAAGRVKPQVERVLPFSQFAEAHRLSQAGHARGKTVLTIP